MMKTIYKPLFSMLLLFGLSASELNAQPDNAGTLSVVQIPLGQSVSGSMASVSEDPFPQPVYFNYRRRRLIWMGQPLDGLVFLAKCRTINDSAVQEQVAQYDELSRQKQRLSFSMLGSSFAGFALLGGAIGNTNGDQELNSMLGCASAVAILAVPVIAIYSSVPHQRRKTVLFRDLPVAYNAYVENCRSMQTCTNK